MHSYQGSVMFCVLPVNSTLFSQFYHKVKLPVKKKKDRDMKDLIGTKKSKH